jgi:hypothetical protein
MTVDLLRLARAVHLDAEPVDGGAWRVAGGATSHTVTPDGGCDCTDYGVRAVACKHVLAVRLRSGERETLDALRALVPLPPRRAGARAAV